MATYLFHVDVLEKEDRSIRLSLRIISAEQTAFPETEYFALLLIHSKLQSEGAPESPISKEMTFDNLADEKWMDNNVDRFIERVSVTDIMNLPLKADLKNMTERQREAFWESDDVPQATMEIVVISERWLCHIAKGDTWDTTVSDPW